MRVKCAVVRNVNNSPSLVYAQIFSMLRHLVYFFTFARADMRRVFRTPQHALSQTTGRAYDLPGLSCRAVAQRRLHLYGESQGQSQGQRRRQPRRGHKLLDGSLKQLTDTRFPR